MQTRTIHVAIYDHLADWEIGYLTAALNDPQFHARPGSFAVRTVGETSEAVTTMGGLRVVPDLVLAELTPNDSAMLVLPGSSGWDDGAVDADRWAGAAQRFLGCGIPVAAICGATYGLGARGLLDDRDHTSAAEEYLAMAPGYHGGGRYLDADAVNDGGLITAGPTNPVAFAREAIAELGAFAPDTLDAWSGLYATGDPACYYRLMGAVAA